MLTEENRLEREALREVFPRGRFVEDEDGTCILRARRASCVRDHAFLQARGKLLGLYYEGSPRRYLKRVGNLVRKHLAGDKDGILHLEWTPELAKALPMFSRSNRKGRSAEAMAKIRPAMSSQSTKNDSRIDSDGSTWALVPSGEVATK